MRNSRTKSFGGGWGAGGFAGASGEVEEEPEFLETLNGYQLLKLFFLFISDV